MSVGSRQSKDGLKIRAVIVDDEPTAREYLKLLLTRAANVEVEAECGDAAEALRAAAQIGPDVVFLDIHLPDESGMEVARSLAAADHPPQLVFITGYDEYALPAFEVAAVDYVMKPFNQERLQLTLDRVRSHLGARPEAGNGLKPAELGKLAIKSRDGCRLIEASEICYARTHNRKTQVFTPSGSYQSQYTLSELESKLAGQRFFRANEGCLVNLDCVEEILYYGPRTYELLLSKPKDTLIPLSRSRAQQLRSLLDF